MMKKSRFLGWLFRKLHLRMAKRQDEVTASNDVADFNEPKQWSANRGQYPDHGGDAWNVTLSATAQEDGERSQTVGARKHQRQPEMLPERCV